MTDPILTAKALEHVADWIDAGDATDDVAFVHSAALRDAAGLIREQRDTIARQTGRIAALEMMLKRPAAAQRPEPVPPAPVCLETSPWGARIVPPGEQPQPGPFKRLRRWVSGKGGGA